MPGASKYMRNKPPDGIAQESHAIAAAAEGRLSHHAEVTRHQFIALVPRRRHQADFMFRQMRADFFRSQVMSADGQKGDAACLGNVIKDVMSRKHVAGRRSGYARVFYCSTTLANDRVGYND